MSRKVVFRRYAQDQLSLLPPSYYDLVPKNHPVRIVNTIIDHLNIDKLAKTYKGGGTSSYHPRMLLKVIYVEKVYADEEQEHNTPNFEAIDPEQVSQTIAQINKALEGKEVDKKAKQKLSYAKKNWPSNIDKYNKQEEQLGKTSKHEQDRS